MGAQRYRYFSWVRFFIATVGILLLAAATVVWILSNKHIIQGDWSIFFGPISATLGIAVSLLAWIYSGNIPKIDPAVLMQLLYEKTRDLTDEAALLSFIDDLIFEVNQESVAFKPEYMLETKRQLLAQVNNAIHAHLLNLLSERELSVLNKLLIGNASNLEIDQFLERRIPNIELQIAQALLQFRVDYLQTFQIARKLAPKQEKKQ